MRIHEMENLVIKEPIQEIKKSISDIGQKFFHQFIGKFFMHCTGGKKWRRYGRISNGFIYLNNQGWFSMQIDYINQKGFNKSVTLMCDRYTWQHLHFFDSWDEMDLYKEVAE